jgi:2-oxoisovalerate dehydrogenase E2 component (dihydrolipoyl transacylase)
MKYFKLPDLGEGLQDAEIVAWHVNEGDEVVQGQPLLSVETAKAIVEIPAPRAGRIAALFGAPGDLLHVGEPLLEYAGGAEDESVSVVGDMRRAGDDELFEDNFIIGAPSRGQRPARVPATPAIRALARRLGVDLAQLGGSGRHGLITAADVEQAARLQSDFGNALRLSGVRRVMAQNMARAHAEVVGVTLHDEVDIQAWDEREDVTMSLVRAIAAGCQAEPILNSWFDGQGPSLRVIERVDLGIAVDTPEGLFVPVLRNINGRNPEDLRAGLDALRKAVKARSIPPQEMRDATFTLSNFGMLAGRHANPVVQPPTVAILGAGRIRDGVVAQAGRAVVHRLLPLSLSFDHRAVTGGEAARCLAAIMEDLAQP